MPEKKLNRRQQQALETKNKIFETARRLFREHGITQTSIQMIVSEVGVSIGTFYLYFKSKEEIIAAIYSTEEEFLVNHAKMIEGDNCREKIINFLAGNAKHIAEDGLEVLRQLYQPTNPYLMKRSPAIQKSLTELLQEGIASGELKAGIPIDEMSDCLMQLSCGIIFDYILRDGEYDIESRTRTYIGYALEGFLCP
ncbi:MAG: TetR/AcrR family transcriptional regulator [Clostridiales bacterium]|nr:TetR/AcrR family transcriptional regulator [Clostridiales bacterium]